LLGFLLLLAVVWAVFPLIWLFSVSIKTEVDAFALPPPLIFTPTFDNYSLMFVYDPSLITDIWNSVVVALTATLMALAIAVPAAYALCRLRLRRQESISYGILWTSMVPVMGIALPFFIMFASTGLLSTDIPLILVYTVTALPLAVLVIRGFLMDLPRELEEAAYIDGSSWVQMMRRVLLPILGPSLGAVAVINFILCWNEFMLAVILTEPSSATAPVGVYTFMGRETMRWGPLASYAIVVTIIPLVFAFITQKYIVRGLSFGAIKG
jgi:ABC-type glycerol-3-phosphate transport system permease component